MGAKQGGRGPNIEMGRQSLPGKAFSGGNTLKEIKKYKVIDSDFK